MHDDTERGAESVGVSSAIPEATVRLEMLDVAAAIAAAENATRSRVFGDPQDTSDLTTALFDASAIAAKGERAAVIGAVERFASMRDALRRTAAARHGMVVHAIAGHGAEELSALADVGWGVLCASGPEDSFDLSLIARRAAEDSGVPFVVVHALGRPEQAAGRAVAMIGFPRPKIIDLFVGEPSARGRVDRAGGDRSFAERVPFALGAALREYGTVTGRRHDTFDKIPLGESPLVLVGAGAVGDALFCATHELRARGYDVGAVHLTALRPFPGPRLVKALGRALAITILEPVDEPLAHGGLLARDVKSAFTDALTWVPGFPGIGRIPKLFVGATGSTFDVSDLAAACENMLADERGRRVFSFADGENTLPRATHEAHTERDAVHGRRGTAEVAIRFVLDDLAAADALVSAVSTTLSNAAGLRAHCMVTTTGAGAVVDLVASRDHARGGMARRHPRLVLASERGIAGGGAVVPLADGAVLGVLGSAPAGALPEAVRTTLRERGARVLPLVSDHPTASAAGASLAVAARTLKLSIDGASVAQVVGEAIAGADVAAIGRRAFESTRDALAGSDAGAIA